MFSRKHPMISDHYLMCLAVSEDSTVLVHIKLTTFAVALHHFSLKDVIQICPFWLFVWNLVHGNPKVQRLSQCIYFSKVPTTASRAQPWLTPLVRFYRYSLNVDKIFFVMSVESRHLNECFNLRLLFCNYLKSNFPSLYKVFFLQNTLKFVISFW